MTNAEAVSIFVFCHELMISMHLFRHTTMYGYRRKLTAEFLRGFSTFVDELLCAMQGRNAFRIEMHPDITLNFLQVDDDNATQIIKSYAEAFTGMKFPTSAEEAIRDNIAGFLFRISNQISFV